MHFGKLKKIIKDKRVLITTHLNIANVDIFSLIFRLVFKSSGLMKRLLFEETLNHANVQFQQKRMSLLWPYEEMFPHFKLLMGTF